MALQTTIVRKLKFAREVTFIIKLTFITKLTFVIEVAMSNNGQPMQLQKTYYKLHNSSPLSIILTDRKERVLIFYFITSPLSQRSLFSFVYI